MATIQSQALSKLFAFPSLFVVQSSLMTIENNANKKGPGQSSMPPLKSHPIPKTAQTQWSSKNIMQKAQVQSNTRIQNSKEKCEHTAHFLFKVSLLMLSSTSEHGQKHKKWFEIYRFCSCCSFLDGLDGLPYEVLLEMARTEREKRGMPFYALNFKYL